MIASTMEASSDRRKPPSSSNPKATFSDGTPMTVEDVEYTFRRGIEGEQYTKLVMGMLTLSSAKNIEIVDPQTVSFKLDKSNPMTERLINLQVMSIQSKKVGEQNATPRASGRTTTGARTCTATAPTCSRAGTAARAGSSRRARTTTAHGCPKNGGLVFRIISDPQERLNLLKSGTLHVAYDVPAKDAAAIRDDGRRTGQARERPEPVVVRAHLQQQQGAVQGQARCVRRSPTRSRTSAIIDNVMYGLARPAKSMVPPGMATHDPSAWKYDTDLAEGEADARPRPATATGSRAASTS